MSETVSPDRNRQSTPRARVFLTLEDRTTEANRMRALRRYDALDTPPDGAFDRITALAAKTFAVPISIVSIVDTDRIWFKSHHGVDVTEVGRDPGLCASAILQDDAWVVTDALKDPRAMTNPLVVGELGLQFYAGFPLITQDGHRLGTLCVIDRKPRQMSPDEVDTLRTLAGVVIDELELRLSARRLFAMEDKRAQELEATAERFERMAEGLEAGLQSSREIGKALGLTMAYNRLTDQAAFESLKRHSQDLNVQLAAIAAEIVEHHNSGNHAARAIDADG